LENNTFFQAANQDQKKRKVLHGEFMHSGMKYSEKPWFLGHILVNGHLIH